MVAQLIVVAILCSIAGIAMIGCTICVIKMLIDKYRSEKAMREVMRTIEIPEVEIIIDLSKGNPYS